MKEIEERQLFLKTMRSVGAANKELECKIEREITKVTM